MYVPTKRNIAPSPRRYICTYLLGFPWGHNPCVQSQGWGRFFEESLKAKKSSRMMVTKLGISNNFSWNPWILEDSSKSSQNNFWNPSRAHGWIIPWTIFYLRTRIPQVPLLETLICLYLRHSHKEWLITSLKTIYTHTYVAYLHG